MEGWGGGRRSCTREAMTSARRGRQVCRDSEFCLDLYRKGRRRREVFQLNADYIALSRYWKYIDTNRWRPVLYLYRGGEPSATDLSHIIVQARVESFSPTRIIETSVNNDSAISRCITKQTRSGITPGLSPLFFSFHLVFPSAIV